MRDLQSSWHYIAPLILQNHQIYCKTYRFVLYSGIQTYLQLHSSAVEVSAINATTTTSTTSTTIPNTTHYENQQSPNSFVIQVHWHVIYSVNRSKLSGFMTFESIKDSINTLNSDFSQTFEFLFNLSTVEWIDNDYWYWQLGPGTDEEIQMKKEQRRGSSAALNVYSTGFVLETRGFSSSIQDIFSFMDGIVVNHRALPGGDLTGFTQGKTLTHEVGHWLGLYHPFEGGCSFPNDLADDTRPQKEPSIECVLTKTCMESDFDDKDFYKEMNRDNPYDAVHNLMNYGNDECLFEFTTNQKQIMLKNFINRLVQQCTV